MFLWCIPFRGRRLGQVVSSETSAVRELVQSILQQSDESDSDDEEEQQGQCAQNCRFVVEGGTEGSGSYMT